MNVSPGVSKGHTVVPLSLGNINTASHDLEAKEYNEDGAAESSQSERFYTAQKRSRVSSGPEETTEKSIQGLHRNLEKLETPYLDSTPSKGTRRETGGNRCLLPHEEYTVVIPSQMEVLLTPPAEHTTNVKPYHISPIEKNNYPSECPPKHFSSFKKADEAQALENSTQMQMSLTQANPPRREAAVSSRRCLTPPSFSSHGNTLVAAPLPKLNAGKQQGLTSPQKARTQSKGPKLTGVVPPSPTIRTRDGRIKVVVRKRPFMAGEAGADCVSVMTPQVALEVTKQRVDLSEYTQRSEFSFDEVFDVSDDNRLVYTSCALELLDVALGGGRASCFAYGQTGSGKTHTMMGNSDEKGLYLLAAADLFRRLPSTHRLDVSFYEIYCNSLFDLLNGRSPVVLREGSDRRVNVCGLSWHPVSSPEHLWSVISAGMEQRKTGSTSANEQSSRSHAILTIRISDITNVEYQGVINFVDLAGSERAADTANNEKQTRLEGAEINKSLLALKECIRALDERKKHVPFRGSRLTEVLRDSFTGNSKTVMIANISPSSVNFEHTANTLRYSFRVKGLSVASVAPDKARNAPRPYPAPTRGRSRTQEHGNTTPMRNDSRGERDARTGKRYGAASPAPLNNKADRASVNDLYKNIFGNKDPQSFSAARVSTGDESLSLTPDLRRKVSGHRNAAPSPKLGGSYISGSFVENAENTSFGEDLPSTSPAGGTREELEERLRREVVEKIQRDLSREIQVILDERNTLIAELRKENAGLRQRIEELESQSCQYSYYPPSLLSTVPHRHQDVTSTIKPSDAFVVKNTSTTLENSEI